VIAVADTSFVLAYMNKADKHNAACDLVYRLQRRVYLPQSTLTEIAFMLSRSGGNKRVAYFLQYLPSIPKFEVIALDSEDIQRTANLLHQYSDTRLDFVDVSVAVVAERLQISRILTLDHRDFSLIRPAHVEHFELLPPLP
jgi:uncharacterized protein